MLYLDIGRPADTGHGQAAVRMWSSCRSQPAIWFQLPLFWFPIALPVAASAVPRHRLSRFVRRSIPLASIHTRRKSSVRSLQFPVSAVLVAGARELMFLVKKGDAYAPVQDQYGRMAVNGDELVDSFRTQPRRLPQTLASIQRLVALQAQASRSDVEADAAYVAALKSSDIESQMWARWKAKDQIKVPSRAFIAEVRAFLTEMQRDPARLVSGNARSRCWQ